MNPRVLELIKNPKNIQSEDLGLLKEEIHTFPYIQNIRALHLYGVHLYEKENYQKELSTTAAYTTDKKILYQLINGKIRQEAKPEIVEEKKLSKTIEKPSQFTPKAKPFPIKREEDVSLEKPLEEKENTCVLPTLQDVKHIYINGERNRILFEGEENFLDEENSETIDIESTLESGTLVTQKAEPVVEEPDQEKVEPVQVEAEENGGEEFTPETIIHEEQISSEKEEEKVEEEENISFHEIAPLVPEVNIEEESVKAESAAHETEIVAEQEPVEQVEIQAEEEQEAGENFTPEMIVNEDQISVEKERSNEEVPSVELSDAEVSFHGTDSFMPDVKIQANNEEIAETVEISKPNVNKHEEEMRRLIEEVEKKMKEAKPVPQEEAIEPEIAEDHEISFAETQNFHFWSTSEDKPAEIKEEPLQKEAVENQLPVEEANSEVAEEKIEETPEVQSAWKPMSVESNMPDSLISKPEQVSTPEIKTPAVEVTPVTDEGIIEETQSPEAVQEEVLPIAETSEAKEDNAAPIESTEEEKTGTLKEDVPVMNVSFFGTDISTLKVEEKKEEPVDKVQEVTMKNTTQSSLDSNVPGFINTWQSWLKIDRTEEIEKEKSEIKEKAIENFIENNPRISQLKEESTYVVKEKNDDISHLMTETLANLYFEQKLYTKAIKAFEILIKKSPEKKEYFESRIQDIKDFRSKN
ncbi:hypothetical protein J2786_004213 [Chryseobacterium vietnamense]|uniref:Uncharacterized protein n=1 Tax=Chryseobacterium vietnamense TaxID=866785 RepID=A0ACC6JE36_9FLAO|nr:hypothetical protein [Chryseobacterium vietnamense]MDR6461062.1 hypothetical protein [Chryseobacterium vietnamense]